MLLRSILTFFILGIGSAILALTVQSLFVDPTAQVYSITILFVLVLTEEISRFTVLALAKKHGLFPQRLFISALTYGIGFVGTELFLVHTNTALYISSLWILTLFSLHVAFSFIAAYTIHTQSFLLTMLGFIGVVFAHWGYNALILFAQSNTM